MPSMRAGGLGSVALPDTRTRPAARRTLLALAAALPLVFALQAGTAAQDGASDATFRPACELVSAEQVGEILGATFTARDLGPLYCALEGEGVAVFVSLDELTGLEINRLVLPDAEDRTVAGHEALFSPAGEQLPATLVVALDGGGILRVQVSQTGDTSADPSAATTAIAEAIFAAGPVMARPPEAASGPRLAFDGTVCELVTLEDMVEVTGDRRFTTVTEDFEDSCTYSSADFTLFVNVAISEGELFLFQGTTSEDVSVGGRAGLWTPDMLNSLFVDIGGGRLLQVAVLVADGSPDELGAMTQAIAELAVGRMHEADEPTDGADGTDVPEVAAGPACDLLSAADVAAITGLPFSRASDEDSSGESCSYSTDDPGNEPWFVIVAQVQMADPNAALEAFAQDMAGLPEPESVQVAGQPALRGGNESVAVAVVDLDRLVDGTDQVLAVAWFFPPAGVDAATLVVQLAEAAVGNL
jgi:hypothetical protein